MSSRINWNIIGPDLYDYSYILGRYVIWLHTQKFEIGFRIVLYSHEVTDVKLSIAPDKVSSIYDAERCNSVEQAMQLCEDALSEILQSAQVIIRDLIAEQDDLIHELSNNEAICEIQNFVSKRDIWRRELNKLEKATRKDG